MQIKKGAEILLKASTKEIYTCLQNEPTWCKLLLNKPKDYNGFLQKLIDNNFFESSTTFTIKQIASDSGYKTDKVTKWICEIYNDIIELNDDETALFKGEGICYELHFTYYDNTAFLSV